MNYAISLLKRVLAAVTLASLLVGTAQAEYPTKPITLISPYGPGGAADLAARTLAASAAGYIGNGVIVANKTGAAGVVGSTFVAKGKKDGYTLLLARVGSQAAVPAVNRKIPYKWDEFTFLGLLEKNPFALVVSPKSGLNSFEDLKAALKSGKKLSYASAGVGTLLHLGVLIMLDDLGYGANAMKHIPFKGGGKAAAALAGGHVDIMFQNLSGVIGAIKAGQIKALAVSTKERFPSIKDVPTVAEVGHPKLETVVGWSALYGPANLPKDVVDKWTKALADIKADKSWVERTKTLSSVPSIENPADTKAFVKTQYEAFKAVVDRLGIAIK